MPPTASAALLRTSMQAPITQSTDARGGVVVVEHEVVADHRAVREQLAERRAAHEERARRVEAAAAVLHGAVGVEQLGGGDAAVRGAVHEIDQVVERTLAHDDVRVEDQHVLAAGGFEALVHCRRIAEVAPIGQHPRPRGTRWAEHLHRAVVGGVVHDQHLDRDSAGANACSDSRQRRISLRVL